MSRRTILVLLGISVLIALGVLAYLALRPASPEVDLDTFDAETPVATSSLPALPSGLQDERQRFDIQGRNGLVSVRNFLPVTDAYGGTHVLNDTDAYTIVYQRSLQRFLVSLYPESAEAISAIAADVATDLKDQLDIDDSGLCGLEIDMSVPDDAAAAFGDARYPAVRVPGCAGVPVPAI